MRKKQIQTLTLMAILTALSIVLKKFSIDTGLFRISLFDTPIIIAGKEKGKGGQRLFTLQYGHSLLFCYN